MKILLALLFIATSLAGCNRSDPIVLIQLHPKNPDIIYVATNDYIYKTLDGGQVWTILSQGMSHSRVIAMAELAQKIVVSENGKKKSITRLQAMVKRIVSGALQGDQKQLLTLVEILRKSGGLEPEQIEGLLAENYETVLDAYVQSRRDADKAHPSASLTRQRKEDER